MSKRAVYSVSVGGNDITSTLDPFLTSISVNDKAGTTSDTAEIVLDDSGGQIVFPKVGAKMTIGLGWADTGLVTIFRGTVDDVNWEVSRGSGKTITVSAKGVDTGEKGKAKQAQKKHFDKKKLPDMMKEAGAKAGITNIKVHPDLASIEFDYEAMNDESFLAFGERIARDVGATFKIAQDQAVMVPRNSGQSASGQTLPTITATYGVNLHTAKISPVLGRSRFKKTKVRYYDQKEAKYKEVEVETALSDADTTFTSKSTESSEDGAKRKAKSDAKDSERESGSGSCTIEGNTDAQPEGMCQIAGTREGVDGTYKIDAVAHKYSRSGGFTTELTLKKPDDKAGKDTRKGSKTSKSSSATTSSSLVGSSGFASPTQRS
jgi:uncharacterized protein